MSERHDSDGPKRRWVALAAILVGITTTILLSIGHREVGYVRDEGIYFVASRAYGSWASKLSKEPAHALSKKTRDRAFRINHEHPPLMKLAAGLSARLFAQPSAPPAGETLVEPAAAGLLPLMPEGAAMRLPAQILAGLGAALLVIAGTSIGGSLVAGLLAAGWFFTLPRVWFNAGLHGFDVPVAVATLAVVLCYRAALVDRRWALALGPLLGIAIVIKHNALFLPLLFALHYGLCLLRAGALREVWLWLPLGLWGVILGAPLTAFALWPWLWSSPYERLAEYFAFHRLHSYYNTEFFGINYNQPPLPTSYPFWLTWATVPSVLLLLAVTGLAIALWRDLRKPGTGAASTDPSKSIDSADKDATKYAAKTALPVRGKARSFSAPLHPEERLDGVLLTLFAIFPIALIALPTVPIFGGTKHWLTAYPFLALAAALAWTSLWRCAGLGSRWRHAPAVGLLLVLIPSTWSTVHSHPLGLSAYAPLVGGARGAAERGLLRGFWGHAVLPLLPEIAAVSDSDRRRFYLHDLHPLCRRQYLREGRWPANTPPAAADRARAGLLFHERHMLSYEVQLWNQLGGVAPTAIVELDDVPLTSLYVKEPRK
ncbi:MAG TPA: hypothetical protein ENJ18_15090 [Nannocystis exedens]|nr:hypothetical protein [Nannocystis exedens]